MVSGMSNIYTVLAKNFADDGVYRLTFYPRMLRAT